MGELKIETKEIQKMVASVETILSLLENEKDRHCYHLGMVKLRLHLYLLRELIEYDGKEQKMPALNFKKEFAEMVKSGEKRQTIRKLRKDGRNPRSGQTLYLYTGMRTKSCRKLGETICKSVQQISIEENKDIYIGVEFIPPVEASNLMLKDGFKSRDDFYSFFRETYGLPFYGLLIKW